MNEQNLEVAFPSSEFTKEEIEQGLDALLGKGTYSITEHKRKPFEDEELGYAPGADAFVVTVLSSVVAQLLAEFLTEFIKKKRGDKDDK